MPVRLKCLSFLLFFFDDALTAFREGIRIQSQLVEQFPDAPEYLQEMARTHANLSTLLSETGQAADAETEGEFALAIQEKAVQQFPSLTAVRVELGGSYCNKGFLIFKNGQSDASIDWFDKAIATLQVVLEREPGHQMASRFLRNSFLGRGLANESRQRPADALQDWARVIELDPSADDEKLRASRAVALLQTGQTTEAVALALELKKLSVWNVNDWYNFACIFSVASTANSDNQEQYAAEAIKAIGNAIESGFIDAEQMNTDTDLDPIRERDDFKKLLDDLKFKQPGRQSSDNGLCT